MNKIFVLGVILIVSMCSIPIVTAESAGNSGPKLETSICTGFNSWVVQIFVENTGEEGAHNVTITDVSVEGNVILNFQESTVWSKDLLPGEMTILDPNSLIIGFGKFTVSMTVSCDEGSTSTSVVEGLIFGPFYFIP